jgi:predicted LPLAT superfamily acyltransferase
MFVGTRQPRDAETIPGEGDPQKTERRKPSYSFRFLLILSVSLMGRTISLVLVCSMSGALILTCRHEGRVKRRHIARLRNATGNPSGCLGRNSAPGFV